MNTFKKGDLVFPVPPPGGRGYTLSYRPCVVIKGTRGKHNAMIQITEETIFKGALVSIHPDNLRLERDRDKVLASL